MFGLGVLEEALEAYSALSLEVLDQLAELVFDLHGEPTRIRTENPRIKSPLLYQVELWARKRQPGTRPRGDLDRVDPSPQELPAVKTGEPGGIRTHDLEIKSHSL